MIQFLIAGGPFMLFLVLTSIVSLTFIIERGLALRRNKVVPPGVCDALKRCRSKDDLTVLQVACQQQPSPLGRLVLTAVEHLSLPKAENQDAIQTHARQEVVLLERGLVVLEVIVGISPLLGLVGTLHGLITLFGDLGRSGLADNAVLAKGIAIALNTTLMGLLIAIPSLIFWSSFTKRVETLTVEMETMMDDFVRRQYRLKRPAPQEPAVKGLSKVTTE
jgi:biopolymer transport protein ExbB